MPEILPAEPGYDSPMNRPASLEELDARWLRQMLAPGSPWSDRPFHGLEVEPVGDLPRRLRAAGELLRSAPATLIRRDAHLDAAGAALGAISDP